MDRSLTDAWFYRLKAAQRDLIKIAGGIERAAEITSISKSHVGRMANSTDVELMPLQAVLRLEAETGRPLVTQAMAAVNGRRLSDPDEDATSTGTLLSRYSETIRQAGELMATGATAFADGRVTPSEAMGLDRASAILEQAIGDLRQQLAGVRAAGGTTASIHLVGED